MKSVALLFLIALAASPQNWPQWGQNPAHTGSVFVAAQRPTQILGQFTYDELADQIRGVGDLKVHYMAPLVDGDDVFTMSRGASTWASCTTNPAPCGTQLWGQMTWGITKLHAEPRALVEQWTALTTWKPPPDTGSGWEPVFHPALDLNYIYAPGVGGMVMRFDRQSGALIDCFQPFSDTDPTRYVVSPLTLGPDGSIYYTVLKLDAAAPWTTDAAEAWLVKIDPARHATKISFAALISGAPVQGCSTTFAGLPLPWPPAPDAVPPVAPCGSQRPALNAAPALAPDGTIYIVSRAHFNSAYSYIAAVNSDLTPRWTASLRDRLSDGCDVLLPPSGSTGGCRAGSLRGVDPTTNQMPAGQVADESSASPAVAPDGSVLLGTLSRYNYNRGHLFRFSSTGDFLAAYDFGWDVTPAVYRHDGTWSVIVKNNFYPIGSYCDVLSYCGEGAASYSLTSLTPDLSPEWTYKNTNDQSCQRLPDGTISCTTTTEGFEWCVNMVAVDRNGVVYANSEDGNLYAIDARGNLAGHLFLKQAIGAAYTPLSVGGDGRVYTQNDGTLFVTGKLPRGAFQPK